MPNERFYYENHSIISNQSNTIVPNNSCCSNPHNLCIACARSAGVVDNRDILPDPSRLWEEAREEDRKRLAGNANYFGKASLPPDTEPVEPPPMFAPRHFDDVLLAAEPVAKAPSPPDPRSSKFVTNLPDVKGDVMPSSAAMWAQVIAEDRRRMNLP